jgi:hypothetical protein
MWYRLFIQALLAAAVLASDVPASAHVPSLNAVAGGTVYGPNLVSGPVHHGPNVPARPGSGRGPTPQRRK